MGHLKYNNFRAVRQKTISLLAILYQHCVCADTYSIPHGVFMFLGYSEKDETLLKQYNNVTVLDAVSSLDNFMRKEVNNQVRRCRYINRYNLGWMTFRNCRFLVNILRAVSWFEISPKFRNREIVLT